MRHRRILIRLLSAIVPRTVIELFVIVGLIAMAVSYLLEPRDDKRDECEQRMQRVAAAKLHYAMTHGSAYPDDLKKCPEVRQLDSRDLICPNSSLESHPPRATTAGAALDAGEAVSYIYVGNGVKDTHAINVVIWLESNSNHSFSPHAGMNVAFADGAVQWMWRDEAEHILAQVAAGTRPVTVPIESTTRP
jgi:prepilin-type processing-associated H-X9-DG protein